MYHRKWFWNDSSINILFLAIISFSCSVSIISCPCASLWLHSFFSFLSSFQMDFQTLLPFFVNLIISWTFLGLHFASVLNLETDRESEDKWETQLKVMINFQKEEDYTKQWRQTQVLIFYLIHDFFFWQSISFFSLLICY